MEVNFGPEQHRDVHMFEEAEITCFSSNNKKLEFYWTINGQQVEPELSEGGSGGGNGDTESKELAKIDGLKVIQMDDGHVPSLNTSMTVNGTSESVYNITCRGFYRESNDSASNYTLLTVKKFEGNSVSPSATLVPVMQSIAGSASTGMTDPLLVAGSASTRMTDLLSVASTRMTDPLSVVGSASTGMTDQS